MKCDRFGSAPNWLQLRYARHLSGQGSTIEASHTDDFMPATNVRTRLEAVCYEQLLSTGFVEEVDFEFYCRKVRA